MRNIFYYTYEDAYNLALRKHIDVEKTIHKKRNFVV